MDPFLDLIQLLRPKATLWAGIEAVGRWGLAFRERHDLLFCWVLAGECQLVRPDSAPVMLRRDDFLLVRTSTPFTLTSDPSFEAQDSEDLVAATKSTRFKLGEGGGAPAVLRGGRFVFDTANEDLLTGLLPQVLHVTAVDTSSARVRALLKMNEEELLHPLPGSELVIARLMELILVEVFRTSVAGANPQQTGLLAGLRDPVTACALRAMHQNIAHAWTVAALARRCGASRSTFASRFSEVVGTGPIDYLSAWRMAVARDELRKGMRSIGEIALAVGFQSTSAFSTAFRREAGCSPKAFAAAMQPQD